MTEKRVFVVIPAYNEERTIVEVIRGLKQHGFTSLIVIDDGSTDRTGELASHEEIIRLRHVLNRGLGGALGTGIDAALRLGAEVRSTTSSGSDARRWQQAPSVSCPGNSPRSSPRSPREASPRR